MVVHGNDDRAALHGGRSEVDRGLAEVRADLDERAKHGVPLRRGVEGHALVRRHEPRRRLGRRAKHRIHPAMLSPDRHPANASDRVSTPLSGWSVKSPSMPALREVICSSMAPHLRPGRHDPRPAPHRRRPEAANAECLSASA